jgi:hypothetical protein
MSKIFITILTLAINAAYSGVSGEKTIFLPGNYDVTEILSGRKKGINVSSFTEQIDAPQTKIYKLTRIK